MPLSWMTRQFGTVANPNGPLKSKICVKCKFEKPIEEFYRYRKKSQFTEKFWDCHDCLCNSCRAQKRQRDRDVNKQKAIEYLGGKCFDCGLVDIPEVFDFHHLNLDTKDKKPAAILRHQWDYIIKELYKCILLCANCHRKRHVKDQSAITQKIKDTKARNKHRK